MRTEDLKIWLKGVENKEKAQEKGEESFKGAGDTWRMLVKLIQNTWDTGEIPRQMLLIIVVLVPKGNTGEYRGIGLLEVLWKVIELVLDERVLAIEVHDSLHGFHAKRGCSTGIMEAKLVQHLTFIEQCPLFGVFINLRKAYDAIDQERVVDILKEAGVGPKALRLIILFWERTQLICKVGWHFGRVFQAKRAVTRVAPSLLPSSTSWSMSLSTPG